MTRQSEGDTRLAAGEVSRRVPRAPRRFAPRPPPRPRPHAGARPRPRVRPVQVVWSQPDGHRLPWPAAWGLVALGGIGVVLAVRILVRFPDANWLASGLLALAVIALARALLLAQPVIPGTIRQGWARRRYPGARAPGILVFFATLATLVAFVRRWEVDLGPAGWDVGAPWLASILLVGLVAWWPSVGPWLAARRSGRGRVWSWPSVAGWAPWAGMMTIAAAPQVLALDRFPAFITGDEGEYLTMAVSAREGTLVNPFAVGWFEVPSLYPAVGGWIATVAGDGLAGYRLIGGLVGTIGVLATWRLGRYLVGPWPALAGACLMATLPFQLMFSRSAMNHAMDPASLSLTLLFLWRAVHGGRRGDAWLAGAMMGLGWYGYWGARAYPLIVVLVLTVMATDRRFGWWNALRWGLWSALGFVVTAGPLLVTFAMHPNLFRSRIDAATATSATAWRAEPGATLRQVLDTLRDAITFPFGESLRIFFRHEAPFLGWPVALLIAIGAAGWLAGLARERDWRKGAWLVVPWTVLTLGLSTSTPLESQRFVALIPLWMLVAGCGVVTIAGWGTAIGAAERAWAFRLVTAAIVATVAVSSITWAWSDERLLANWGDRHSLTAWDVGWRLGQEVPGDGAAVPVMMAGAPHLFLDDWDNLRFLAPGAVVTDIEGDRIDPNAPLDLPDGTLLLLTGERAAESCHVEAIYPGTTVAEVHAQDGSLLYLAFYRGTLPGWETGESPEGTTWATTEPEPCPAVG